MEQAELDRLKKESEKPKPSVLLSPTQRQAMALFQMNRAQRRALAKRQKGKRHG